jgi:F-type H+-transporting ATPase subunit epsilon
MAEVGANSGLLTVRLVTPDRLLLEATAEGVELPSASGYLEALYGAAPLLAELGAGEVRLHGGDSGEQKFFVAWGFVEVLPERVTILAETALKPEEIDTAGARADLDAGHAMWNQAGDDPVKYEYANAQMREAEEKLASSEGRG